MARIFTFHIECGEEHEWIELCFEWHRCTYMSLEVLGVVFIYKTLKSCKLDKEGMERLIAELEHEEGNPNPMKELIKDDKQIAFLKPTFYENCALEVFQNAVKLVYFNQLPSDEFIAHCTMDSYEFRALMKKIKEENLPFEVYIYDQFWYDC